VRFRAGGDREARDGRDGEFDRGPLVFFYRGYNMLIYRDTERYGGTYQTGRVAFEPNEYADLEAIARKRKESVGSLIRKAIRQVYLDKERQRRREAIERLLSEQFDFGDWRDIKEELEEERYKQVMKSVDENVLP
jgi:hypothetical protein